MAGHRVVGHVAHEGRTDAQDHTIVVHPALCHLPGVKQSINVIS